MFHLIEFSAKSENPIAMVNPFKYSQGSLKSKFNTKPKFHFVKYLFYYVKVTDFTREKKLHSEKSKINSVFIFPQFSSQSNVLHYQCFAQTK